MTANQVFVDTGGWAAVLVSDDKFHKPAAPAFRALVDGDTELVTSNYVIAELITLLRRQAAWHDFQRLVRQFSDIMREGYVSLVNIGARYDNPLHESFMHWFDKFPRECLSYADCVSFEIMSRMNLKKAFAFDRHFEKAGFQLIPGLPLCFFSLFVFHFSFEIKNPKSFGLGLLFYSRR